MDNNQSSDDGVFKGKSRFVVKPLEDWRSDKSGL
jgi:hypothetical protein